MEVRKASNRDLAECIREWGDEDEVSDAVDELLRRLNEARATAEELAYFSGLDGGGCLDFPWAPTTEYGVKSGGL